MDVRKRVSTECKCLRDEASGSQFWRLARSLEPSRGAPRPAHFRCHPCQLPGTTVPSTTLPGAQPPPPSRRRASQHRPSRFPAPRFREALPPLRHPPSACRRSRFRASRPPSVKLPGVSVPSTQTPSVSVGGSGSSSPGSGSGSGSSSTPTNPLVQTLTGNTAPPAESGRQPLTLRDSSGWIFGPRGRRWLRPVRWRTAHGQRPRWSRWPGRWCLRRRLWAGRASVASTPGWRRSQRLPRHDRGHTLGCSPLCSDASTASRSPSATSSTCGPGFDGQLPHTRRQAAQRLNTSPGQIRRPSVERYRRLNGLAQTQGCGGVTEFVGAVTVVRRRDRPSRARRQPVPGRVRQPRVSGLRRRATSARLGIRARVRLGRLASGKLRVRIHQRLDLGHPAPGDHDARRARRVPEVRPHGRGTASRSPRARTAQRRHRALELTTEELEPASHEERPYGAREDRGLRRAQRGRAVRKFRHHGPLKLLPRAARTDRSHQWSHGH